MSEPVVEPTEAMLIAARDWSQHKYGKPIGNDAAIGCWKAMLSAAPLQQEADKDGERLREFLDENMTFMEVKHDHPTAGPNIPVLASVSKRIWYHATDDTESWPFSKVIDAALPSDDKVKP